MLQSIPMVNLQAQYLRFKSELDEAVIQTMAKADYIQGNNVRQFENELAEMLNVKHVISCANGTDALQIALMALDLKPGDEVITPSFTYIATTEVIALLGLVPVFVDVLPDTFCIDPSKIEEAITPKTKVIVPVHLYGQCADMDNILTIAKKHNLAVVEDTAQAIGAEYIHKDGSVSKAGTMGDIGCTSFFPSKNLGCFGDGGAMYTNSDDLASKMQMIANHGQSVQYYHDSIGVNSRLDSMQAAILRIKLRHLDSYAAARNKAADYYDKAFAGHPKLKTPKRAKNTNHVFHQYTLQLIGADRMALKEFLASKEIPMMIYYPVPLHLQKAYLDPRYKQGDFPVTEQLCSCVFSLPMHTELDEETLKYITDSVKEFLK